MLKSDKLKLCLTASVFVAAVFWSGAGSAQDAVGALTGVIKDAAGAPVAGAFVSCWRAYRVKAGSRGFLRPLPILRDGHPGRQLCEQPACPAVAGCGGALDHSAVSELAAGTWAFAIVMQMHLPCRQDRVPVRQGPDQVDPDHRLERLELVRTALARNLLRLADRQVAATLRQQQRQG